MSYWDSQVNKTSWEKSNIELNGGWGSSAHWDAIHRENAARAEADRMKAIKSSWNFDSALTTTPSTWIPTGPASGRSYQKDKVQRSPALRDTLQSFLIFLLFSGLAIAAFLVVISAKPPFPIIHHVTQHDNFRYASSRGSSQDVLALRERRIEDFKKNYEALFGSSMPWDRLAPKCPSNPRSWECAHLSWDRLQSLKSHMIKPADFAQDFCDAAWKSSAQQEVDSRLGLVRFLTYQFSPFAQLPKPIWKYEAVPQNERYFGWIRCSLLNKNKMEESINGVNAMFVLIAFAVFTVFFGFGLFFSRKFRKIY